jgi:hypothetical protein
MKAAVIGLTTAMLLSAASGDELPASYAVPVGCIDLRSLWDLINAEDNHDTIRVTELMRGRCRSLVGVRYLVESEHNGVSQLRIFSQISDWSTSSVVYALDEMVRPEQELHLLEESKQSPISGNVKRIEIPVSLT